MEYTQFKMKGSEFYGHGNQNKSPIPLLDVEIDGENVVTGDEAYAKGRIAEEKKSDAWAEGTEAGQSKEALAQNLRVSKARQKSIKYTGVDAHKRIKDSDMSEEEKTAAHAKVRGGESYDK